jgi:DNA-directed RNA polymerase specialized sigma subunit
MLPTSMPPRSRLRVQVDRAVAHLDWKRLQCQPLGNGFDHITNREAVRPLLAALPERERTMLYLRFFASMTQSQIAEQVGVSQMHVSRILERTLSTLRNDAVGPL